MEQKPISVDDYVAQILATAPPLTNNTASRITALLSAVNND